MDKSVERDRHPRDEEALGAILAEVESGTIRLYRNVLRQPCVVCAHPNYPHVHLHLHDKEFHEWLTHFIWKSRCFLLRGREIDRIVKELAGRSLSSALDKIHDPALLQFIESEPVVAVVLEFMHTLDNNCHESTMNSLWKELQTFARRRRLLVLGKRRFPGGDNVLSRKLTAFLLVFEQLGITIVITRSNGCKVTLSRRLDDSSKQSSAESSASNSSTRQALSSKDDKAERIQRLQQRKNPN